MPKCKRLCYLLLPVLPAFFLILSFPPWDQGYFAWVCFLPLFYYIEKQGSFQWQSSFLPGFFSGLIFFLSLYAYMALAVNFLFPRYFGFLVIAAASLYSACYFGLFSLGLSYLQKSNNTLFTVVVPALWVLLEYLRSLGFLGHTGGFIAYSQSSYIPLLQSVSLYGYWGLAFLMVFFQTLLFRFWQCIRRKKCKQQRAELIISSFLFLVLLGCGMLLPSLFPVKEKDKALRIALIQGNIPQGDILDPSAAQNNFQQYLHLSREADKLYAPLDLIVWPETVFSRNVARNFCSAESEIALLAGETGASILLGAMYEDNPKKAVYNSILLQESGENSLQKQRYDKRRLVPFAEYFPFPALLKRIWPLEISLGTYAVGTGTTTFALEDFVFGGIICFESYFPRPARDLAQKGAEHLFVLSNDAWFLNSSGLEQHARVAAIRALETGIGVTQVANTGRTISFDYKGREVLSMPVWTRGSALLETNLPKRLTLYSLWGDYFLYLCLVILIGPEFLRIAVRKKRYFIRR